MLHIINCSQTMTYTIAPLHLTCERLFKGLATLNSSNFLLNTWSRLWLNWGMRVRRDGLLLPQGNITWSKRWVQSNPALMRSKIMTMRTMADQMRKKTGIGINRTTICWAMLRRRASGAIILMREKVAEGRSREHIKGALECSWMLLYSLN